MDKNELYLKTLFCCSACDGNIASEEISLIKELSSNSILFKDLNVEDVLNSYIGEINAIGKQFLKNYLNEISDTELNDSDQVQLIDTAIKMIEADNQILYSEVKFFKKIRNRLSVADDVILASLPNCEDYLLPDISSEDKDFENIGDFQPISFTS